MDGFVDAVLSIPITVVLAMLILSLVVGVGLWLEFARPSSTVDDFSKSMDGLRRAVGE